MWDPLFYNNATVSVAFPTPLAWRFLSSTVSFNVGSSAANRAFRCFAHTITAGVTAAITSAKTTCESKGRRWAATRERSGSVPSSCGERQQSGSLLCRGISASHLHFAAHAEIFPLRFIFYSVCFAAHPSFERQGGGQGVGKQTTHILCVVQGGEGRGCGDGAAGSFPAARGRGEREKGIGE